MQDAKLHPADAAAMRDGDDHDGPLRQQLSNAAMALYKRYYGKGPTGCRTYLEADLVVIVLTGGWSAGEQTLFEAGQGREVRRARLLWQEAMHERFSGTVEHLTHRTVTACLSANRQAPDLAVELFVLAPEDGAAVSAG